VVERYRPPEHEKHIVGSSFGQLPQGAVQAVGESVLGVICTEVLVRRREWEASPKYAPSEIAGVPDLRANSGGAVVKAPFSCLVEVWLPNTPTISRMPKRGAVAML